jgi:hypothetical protein
MTSSGDSQIAPSMDDSAQDLAPRAAAVGSGRPGAARKQVDDQRNDGKNQQQVNQKSGDVEKHESASPKNHEQDRQTQKRSKAHNHSPSRTMVAEDRNAAGRTCLSYKRYSAEPGNTWKRVPEQGNPIRR